MSDLNKVFLVGRLGSDPIQRETKNRTSVAHLSVATARKFKSESPDGAEVKREETQWHRVVVWGRSASYCKQYMKKGQTVLVEGMIRSHKFDGKDGASRISFEVHADQVAILSSPRKTVEDSSLDLVADSFGQEQNFAETA